jgi:DNA-3-methyladenine glycosylase
MDLEKILNKAAPVASRQILGWQLYAREPEGTLVGGMITETEAYNEEDAASHSFNGKTLRNQVMFGPAGYIYTYFTYGMHWCLNIVTGPKDNGEAVLIRAIQPNRGLDIMRQRRSKRSDNDLTNGPAKLCQALNITGEDNGGQLNSKTGKFLLLPPETDQVLRIVATTRLGIKRDTHRLWRFLATNN